MYFPFIIGDIKIMLFTSLKEIQLHSISEEIKRSYIRYENLESYKMCKITDKDSSLLIDLLLGHKYSELKRKTIKIIVDNNLITYDEAIAGLI